MLIKAASLFAVMALSVSTASAFQVNTSLEYQLQGKDIQSGTQNQASGFQQSNATPFVADAPAIEPEIQYRSARFKCDTGQVLNGLICSGEQIISAPTKCQLPTPPPYSAVYCSLVSFSTESRCHYSLSCQGSGTKNYKGTFVTACPNGFTEMSNGKCKRSTLTSAKPFCESGWKLNGYMCSK